MNRITNNQKIIDNFLESPDNNKIVGTFIIDDIACELVKTVIVELIKYAASEALDSIDDDKIDMEHMRTDLAQIVKDANVAQTVYEQEGIINAQLKYMKINYEDAKQTGSSKEELYNLLTDTVGPFPKLIDACNILSTDDTKRKGILTYISGATILFSVLQEMSKQDPSVVNLIDNRHVLDLAKYTCDSIKYVSDLVELIRSERLAFVSEIDHPDMDDYNFMDFFTGASFEVGMWEDERLRKYRETYIQSLIDSFNFFYDFVRDWKRMITSPTFSRYNPYTLDLLGKSFTIWDPMLSDLAGWNKPEYYETIQCADIDGDGQAELIARSAGGIMAWKYDPLNKTWIGLPMGPEWSDKEGWGQPQYYETIQCADIDGDRRAELIARSAGGIMAWKYDPLNKTWIGLPMGPELSDGSILADWSLQQYYETIQFADIDGDQKAELIARDSIGLFTHWWSKST
jgi:hypothetical protein